LKLTDKQTKTFLFAVQGVGAIFGGIFLAAYFGGLPSTATLNSEPAFIVSQSVIGAILIAFVLVALVFAVIINRKE